MNRLSRSIVLVALLSMGLSSLNAGYTWLAKETYKQAVFLQGCFFKLQEKYGTQDATKKTDPNQEFLDEFQKPDPFVIDLVSKALREQQIKKPVVILQDNRRERFLNAAYFKSPKNDQDYILVCTNSEIIGRLKRLDSSKKDLMKSRWFNDGNLSENLKIDLLKKLEREHYCAIYHEIGHMVHEHQSVNRKSLNLALFTGYFGSTVFIGKLSKDFVKKYITKMRGTGTIAWLAGSYIPLRMANLFDAYRSRRDEGNADAFATMKLIESGHRDVVLQNVVSRSEDASNQPVTDSLFNFSTHPDDIERAKSSLDMLQRYGIDIHDVSSLPKDWTKGQKKQYFEQLNKMPEFKKQINTIDKP